MSEAVSPVNEPLYVGAYWPARVESAEADDDPVDWSELYADLLQAPMPGRGRIRRCRLDDKTRPVVVTLGR